MKKIIFLIVLFLAFSFSSAFARGKIIKLTGSIAGKHPIKMVLNIQDGKVLGYYSYKKYGGKILLKGNIEGSKIILKEMNNSSVRARFIGNLSHETISGTWTKTYGDEQYPFKISIQSEKELKLTEQIKSIVGKYKSTRYSKYFIGTARIKYISDNIFYFELSTARQNCIGDLQNIIKFKNFKKGTFSDYLCNKLTLILKPNKLKVLEKPKCAYHGVSCWFTGTYIKQ